MKVKDLIKILTDFPMDSEITINGDISKNEIENDNLDYVPFTASEFDFKDNPQRLFITLQNIEILPF